MSHRTFPVGKASVPLILTVNNNGPVTGLSPFARILVPALSLEFDFGDNTFKAAGTAGTPTIPLAELPSPSPGGVYFASWITSSIVADTDTLVIYESTSGTIFIADDPVDFQTAGAGTTTIINGFLEAAFDKTNRTLTLVGGVKNAESGLIASSAAVFTVKDELGNVLFVANTVSTTGIHRAVIPNVTITPNRVLIVEADFTAGASVISTVETLAVIGKDSD